jgi:hypothetical protein
MPIILENIGKDDLPKERSEAMCLSDIWMEGATKVLNEGTVTLWNVLKNKKKDQWCYLKPMPRSVSPLSTRSDADLSCVEPTTKS